MTENRTKSDAYMLRLPDGMRDELKASAAANHRSMNEEIIARLSGGGKTLRDEFAGQALAGMMANPGGPIQANSLNGWGLVNCDEHFVAKNCYAMAEAMLEAREAKP